MCLRGPRHRPPWLTVLTPQLVFIGGGVAIHGALPSRCIPFNHMRNTCTRLLIRALSCASCNFSDYCSLLLFSEVRCRRAVGPVAARPALAELHLEVTATAPSLLLLPDWTVLHTSCVHHTWVLYSYYDCSTTSLGSGLRRWSPIYVPANTGLPHQNLLVYFDCSNFDQMVPGTHLDTLLPGGVLAPAWQLFLPLAFPLIAVVAPAAVFYIRPRP